MRRTLFALLATCSLAAHANDNWKPFPLDQKAYDYSGDKLRQAWGLVPSKWNAQENIRVG